MVADTFTFAVYPVGLGGNFEPFVLDVPTTLGQDSAARRAYFTAMAHLAGQGFDVEDFAVTVWDNQRHTNGPAVTSRGLVDG